MFGHLVPKLCLVLLLIFAKVEIQAAYYSVLKGKQQLNSALTYRVTESIPV